MARMSTPRSMPLAHQTQVCEWLTAAFQICVKTTISSARKPDKRNART